MGFPICLLSSHWVSKKCLSLQVTAIHPPSPTSTSVSFETRKFHLFSLMTYRIVVLAWVFQGKKKLSRSTQGKLARKFRKQSANGEESKHACGVWRAVQTPRTVRSCSSGLSCPIPHCNPCSRTILVVCICKRWGSQNPDGGVLCKSSVHVSWWVKRAPEPRGGFFVKAVCMLADG